MSASWDIPTEWGIRKLGDIAPENSTQVNPSEFPDEMFNYWSLDAIDKGIFEEPNPNWVRGAQVSSNCVKFNKLHVLYAKLRPYLNKVIVPSVEGIGSTEWLPLKPDPAKLDRYYLAYMLRTSKFVRYAQTHTTGARMPRVRKDALWDADIPLPFPDEPARSLAEQRRIVARIEALLAEVREMRALQERIDKNCNKLMDAFLGEIFAPRELAAWPNQEPIGEIAEITARQVNPTLPEYRNMPHVYGATIEEGTGRLLAFNSAAEDGMTSGKYHFRAGAVLYSKIRPYLRKATIVDFDGLCSADMYPLQLKTSKVRPEFLMWSLLSPPFTAYANELSRRARMPKLNRPQLFAYEFAYPQLAVQDRIITMLQAVREEIFEMQKGNHEQEESLTQLEQAILTQAFSGKL